MTGSGDGVHVLTGPIFVEDAVEGDVLKVEILELYPRLVNGESYGVNVRFL
jgi:acetamidase/formamidase